MKAPSDTYTMNELTKIQAAAQSVADRANAMGTMLIYTNGNNQSATGRHQNGLQGAFSELHDIILGSDFEIAQIDAQKPTKPSPRDFAVFNDVVGIIGYEEAVKQLQLVIGAEDATPIFDRPDLHSAFEWDATPQGWMYWFNVRAEIEKLKE